MKTKLLKSFFAIAIFAIPFNNFAQDTYDINPSGDGIVSDATAMPNNNPYLAGNNSGGINSLKIGKSAADGSANTTSALMPFQLPERPTGKQVLSAHLQVHVNYGRQWIASNVDLYGLPYNASNTIYAADHYDDVYDMAHGTDTAIQDDYFTKNVAQGMLDTPRLEDTSTVGDAALLAYITAQYDAGAVAGDYVFLRMNVDDPATTGAHYFAVNKSGAVDPPKLTLVIEAADTSSPTTDMDLPAVADGYVSDIAVVTTNNPFLANFMKLGKSAVDGSGNTTSAIIPFELPARPTGEVVDAANFKVYVSYGRQWVNANVDLYGLPFNASNTLNPNDHYAGAYGAGSGTGIEDDYFVKNVAQGTLDTPRWEESSTQELIDYLNAQYDAGAVAGDFVFLRLSMDDDAMAGSQYFKIEGDDSAEPAVLSIGFSGTAGLVDNQIGTLDIYPNPVVDGKLTISMQDFNQNATLEVYAISGRLVHSEKINNASNEYQTQLNLNTGIYIIKLQNDLTVKTQKLIIK